MSFDCKLEVIARCQFSKLANLEDFMMVFILLRKHLLPILFWELNRAGHKNRASVDIQGTYEKLLLR